MTKKILSEHEKKAWRAMCAAAGVDSGLAATARECDECGVKDESVKSLSSGWLMCADCYRDDIRGEVAEDVINKPSHYTSHPSGIECIAISRHENFNRGNALKYWWRAGLKSENPVEDYKKAIWYLEDEIKRIEGNAE